MNGTLINELTLIKLKNKVETIEKHEELLSSTGYLHSEEDLKLTKARKKLNKLIKQL